ncbi:MAG: radical SAM family heme chaperone HemW [Xanthomonadaceae bacterium]|nr:radical SAM family heme chaperone HemW [Xanthomonadaceae bacterium]
MLPENHWSNFSASGFSLYLHIPFCLSRCHYCAFYSTVTTPVPEDFYLRALLSQFDATVAAWHGRQLKTIYMGGGTPSLLSPSFYAEFLNRLSSHFHFLPDIEISIEANPATLSEEKIKGYQSLGINRFSLGVQTFADWGLKLLGRRHSSADVVDTVKMMNRCGVKNLSIDLIYAYPGQTLAGLRRDLESAIRLDPAHISAYCLSIESGTPLAKSIRNKVLARPSEDDQCRFMEETADFLGDSGYCQYEISNFSRPGFESRHNLAYWELRDYWGLGAGAWSSRRLEKDKSRWATRYMDEPEVEGYLCRFDDYIENTDRVVPATVDNISYETSFAERMIMGLRLVGGVDLAAVAAEYDCNLVNRVLARLEVAMGEGLVERLDDHLRLTARGRMLADEVALEILD